MLYIICVDDQQEVLDSIIRDLRPLANESLRVEEASDEADCLALLQQLQEDGEDVAVILTDQIMPNGSGLELLETVAESPHFYRTRRVILTGLPQDEASERAIANGTIHAYLEKPWRQDELLQALKHQLHIFSTTMP